MKTLEALLRAGTEVLEAAGIGEARLDAWLLLEYLTGRNRAYFFAHRDETAAPGLEEEYGRLIRRRSGRVPLQQITHQAFFMGCEFYVNEHVLIPRQDTEVLAEEALRLLEPVKAPRILDLCTGSGCILISILSRRVDARGTGTDIMEEALKVAEENGRRLLTGDRAFWVKSDTFSADIFQEKNGNIPVEYDMLISNPPYIPTGEIDALMEEVRLHDPREALDGGRDGLRFYRAITAEASRYIRNGGWLLYEIGCDQGEAVSGLLRRYGFKRVEVKKDLSGLDRVVLGQKQEEQNV